MQTEVRVNYLNCHIHVPSKHVEANSRHTYDVTIWLSRTTDNSNIFIRSREVRDNESRLYIYIENLKNLLVWNHWTDFHILLQKCSFGDSLPRLFKPFGFVKKHGRQGAGLIFPIYLYRKLKILLVRNHWTNCYIILQKYSFVILYQDYSSHLDCQKTWLPGGGAYFPYISL